MTVVPRKPARHKTRPRPGKSVYEIDGASFYEIATEQPAALKELYEAVQDILASRQRGLQGEVLEYCRSIFMETFPP